jgi:hypothetical protein
MLIKKQADLEVDYVRRTLRDKEILCSEAINTNMALLHQINLIPADGVRQQAVAARGSHMYEAAPHLQTKRTPRLNQAATALNALLAVVSAGVPAEAAPPAGAGKTTTVLAGALTRPRSSPPPPSLLSCSLTLSNMASYTYTHTMHVCMYIYI